MEFVKKTAPRLPGCGAAVLMIFFTAFWTYWGIAEMYHEGWWGAWYNRLPYLAPIALTLLPTLVSFRWPILGGTLIILVGAFALFFFDNDVAFIGLAIALVGTAFLVDGIVKRRAISQETTIPAPWWRRHWRYLLAIGAPLLIFVGISAYMLPIVLTRVDDGDRSARLIEGNGVALVWAPEGPGWNWKQSWGGYPSWHSIALYGVPPLGLGDKPGYGRQGQGYANIVFATGQDMAQTNLCRYLSADGSALLEEPQDIWRMPTTDEVVRSLVRHGTHAGCAWQGEFRQRASCDVLPDKESPLWSTAQPAIYYWTADSYSQDRGYFVAYNGTVNATYKLGGNPRHGYRCVKEP
jgi:Flp pilus assembly protein protease CpaA